MKVPTLLLFCVIFTVGSYHTSNAASITKREEGESTPSSESGSVDALRTVGDVIDVIRFVSRALSQFEPIRLIGGILGLPLDMLLTPILDALGTILTPVRELLSKSLYSLGPALNEILVRLGRLLGELLDHVANTLNPDSSIASSSSTSASSSSSAAAASSSSSTLSSFSSSNAHRRRRRSFASTNFLYDVPLAIANLLHMPTESTANEMVSVFANVFNCAVLPPNKFPSAANMTIDPLGSMKMILCSVVNRLADAGQGVADSLIPTVMETLKSINETGIIPPPISNYISTLLMLYEMSNSLMNGK